MYKIRYYKTSTGHQPIRDFLQKFIDNNKQNELDQIKLMIDNLGKYGFEINSHSPNSIKKVQGEIWELRPGSNRILYFYLEDNTYILLHGFVKRTQKTPKKEIEKALIEAKDCKRRNSK